MLRTLVVPLDGSELAERALPYALRLASAGNGQLILVRVALAPPPTSIDGANWQQDQTEAVDEAEAYLASVADKLATTVPLKTFVPYGRVAHQILEAIEALGADGVVMATHENTSSANRQGLSNGIQASAFGWMCASVSRLRASSWLPSIARQT